MVRLMVIVSMLVDDTDAADGDGKDDDDDGDADNDDDDQGRSPFGCLPCFQL